MSKVVKITPIRKYYCCKKDDVIQIYNQINPSTFTLVNKPIAMYTQGY